MAGLVPNQIGPTADRWGGLRHGTQDGRNRGFRYPSPWWDVAQMDLPKSFHHMLRWCAYHMLANPLVSNTVRKMASYPITDIVITDEPSRDFSRNKDRWEDCLFRVLNIQRTQQEIGLDYYGYGNCVLSLKYPFNKYLTCANCKETHRIKRLKVNVHWTFQDGDYTLKCPKCHSQGIAKVEDVYYRSYKDIKIIRHALSSITTDVNPLDGDITYFYKIPKKVRSRIAQKNTKYLEETPSEVVHAAVKGLPIVLAKDNIYHFKAPTPTLDEEHDEGWGYPLILPALKDSFHLQIMKKAQEAVMLEHLIPMDIFFPTSQDPNANPYQSINLADWKVRTEVELQKWRMDPNHKAIMPLPMGHQRIGGTGRGLMLTQEIRSWSEHIVAGMGVPQEFVFGGLSWSGSSVSLRMLENQMLTYRVAHEHFLKYFLIPNISRFMGWSQITVAMKPFKMADDMQHKQMLLSMAQMRKIADKTLLAEFGRVAVDEAKLIEQEMAQQMTIRRLDGIQQATIAGEQMLVSANYQMKAQQLQARAQQAQSEPPPEAGQDPQREQHAEALASRLSHMAQHEQTRALASIQQQDSALAQLVQAKLQQQNVAAQQPLPEQRPPRRLNATI